MNIAEFFINLGIKGDDKTQKALKDTDTSLKDMGSNALWAKAAIIGAMWGLERMMSNSNAAGAGMVNFAASTGLSIQKLQEWKYAAQQVNVAGGDVESSMKGIQGTMANMLQGGGAPKGLTMLADLMAKSGEAFDPSKARDMDYMLKNIQTLAQSGPADIVKPMVMSFGATESVFGAMRQNAFTPEVMKKAPKYSDKEAHGLSKMKAGWENIGQKLEMNMGHLFAKYGPKMISDIDAIIPKVTQLVNSLIQLADKTKAFQLIGMAFEGWALILDNVNQSIAESNADKRPGPTDIIAEGWKKDMEKLDWIKKKFGMEPDIPANKAMSGESVKSVTVNNTNNFPNMADNHKKIGDSVAKATKKVVQTSHAQKQEN